MIQGNDPTTSAITLSSESTAMEHLDDELQICANCGTKLTGPYCSNCGQHSDQRRLTFRTFFTRSIQDLFKLNSGSIYTIFCLLTQPWNVIRNFINGHRVRYSTPFATIILLIFYIVIIDSWVDVDLIPHHFNVDLSYTPQEGDSEFHCYMAQLVCDFANTVLTSQICMYIMMAVPMAGATYLTYFKYGSRRYNFTEFLVAAVYMICSLMIIEAITGWGQYLNYNVSKCIGYICDVVIFGTALWKAFKVPNTIIRILLMLVCFGISLALMVCYSLILSWILNIVFYLF